MFKKDGSAVFQWIQSDTYLTTSLFNKFTELLSGSLDIVIENSYLICKLSKQFNWLDTCLTMESEQKGWGKR